MSTAASPIPGAAAPSRARGRDRRRSFDRFGDATLRAVCVAAALLAVIVLLGVGYQVAHGAGPAISRFGLGFVFDANGSPTSGPSAPVPFSSAPWSAPSSRC